MENQSTHSIIPAGELRCVWMDAGVTEFKLCDQELRCESCSFNTNILQEQESKNIPLQNKSDASGQERALTAEVLYKRALTKKLDNLRTFKAPKDRMYSRSHYWIQQNGPGEFRIGINHILANFLRPVLSIVISKAPFNINKHDPFFWIVLPGGAMTLRSPIDATIRRFNPALNQKPSLLTNVPFDDGWIMEVNTKSKVLNGFVPSHESHPLMNRTLKNVEHSFIQAFRHLHQTAGTTLFDGGVDIENIENILGPKVYLSVVNRILHLPT
jgi:glycine cleavage system H protein